jgi:hypothetical protein
MGKAATFHFLERNHLELALQLDTGLSNVENGARNADATTIEKFVSQPTAARQLALQADNEVFGVEQQMLRVLGFGPLIDLPRKDIDDVNRCWRSSPRRASRLAPCRWRWQPACVPAWMA